MQTNQMVQKRMSGKIDLNKFLIGFKNLPSKGQWKQFFSILTKREKVVLFALLAVAVMSGIYLGLNFYFQNTIVAPQQGGSYKEGMVGQPTFISPLHLSTQDIDRNIVEILFSGLMKYDEKGRLVNDLIEGVEIQEKGKIFDVYLKDNIFWQDGEKITADDVVFTINLVQDPQCQSPLRIQWSGIVAEKITDQRLQFKMPKQYSGFLEALTIKILPKHIFENISPQNLPSRFTSQNYLVGSGPFKLKEVVKNKSDQVQKLTLERNKKYHQTPPYLNKISLIFYKDIETLLRAAGVGEIDGFALVDPEYFKNVANGFRNYNLSLPRYFAIFFNLNSKELFSEKELREVVAFSVNKDEVLKEIFLNKGSKINSPILPNFFGFEGPSKGYDFDPAKAQEILEAKGFVLNPETSKREKTVHKEAPFTFKSNLTLKSQGKEVEELQKCLAKDPEVYPEGTVSGYFGSQTKAAVIRFQEKYAQDILSPIGLTKGTGDVKPMTRDKLNEICFERPTEIVPFKITLTTCDKFPLNEIARILQKQWEAIGATVEIKEVSLADLQTNVLAKRDFEVLLFGEALGSIPDPFPFWHSSQKEYPGLNVSSYKSKTADKLLETARETETEEERKITLEKFQDILIDDLPAVFLVRPDYLYVLSSEIKGYNVEKITEPSKRFSTIETWYLKTKRVWK